MRMVRVSGRIYHAAKRLVARAHELDAPEADEALGFLEETGALEISRVWSPEEGSKLLIEIQDRTVKLRDRQERDHGTG